MTLRQALTLAAAALVLAGQPAAARAKASFWYPVMPLGKPGSDARPRKLAVGSAGVTVKFDPSTRTMGEGEDAEEVPATRITVTVPGYPPLEVPADPDRLDEHGVQVGIGKLSASAEAPSVILAGYSGGAHCCATFQLITPVDGSLRVLALPGIDGGPERAFPKDIDGDGTVDIVRQDDRFRYQFTDGAGSWSPPVIYNLADGALADVSAAPRYARLWRSFADKALKACADKHDPGRNGGCAVYAAAMVRLGKAEEGIAAAVRLSAPSSWLPDACTVPLEDETCPAGKERTFAGFEDALRWFLSEQGYR